MDTPRAVHVLSHMDAPSLSNSPLQGRTSLIRRRLSAGITSGVHSALLQPAKLNTVTGQTAPTAGRLAQPELDQKEQESVHAPALPAARLLGAANSTALDWGESALL